MQTIGEKIKNGRVELPGGWLLVRCDDEGSRHYRDWFLSEPQGCWVAKFWDGPEAGEGDCTAFAASLLSIRTEAEAP